MDKGYPRRVARTSEASSRCLLVFRAIHSTVINPNPTTITSVLSFVGISNLRPPILRIIGFQLGGIFFDYPNLRTHTTVVSIDEPLSFVQLRVHGLSQIPATVGLLFVPVDFLWYGMFAVCLP